MTTSDIVLSIVLMVICFGVVSWIVAIRIYNKGVNDGRLQVIEEDLIRMDRNPTAGLDQKIKDFYNQFTKTNNHSRQACKYVEPNPTV